MNAAGIINAIHCGDFIDKSAMLGRRKFDVVIADPPYNIGKDFGNDTDERPLGDYVEWSVQSSWVQTNKHGVKFSIAPSMSWQIWWRVPVNLIDCTDTFEIGR